MQDLLSKRGRRNFGAKCFALIVLSLATVCTPVGVAARPVAHPDEDAVAEPLPETVLLSHKNGSLTVTVDGKDHKLAPRGIRSKAAELLKGREHIVMRMEDWKQFGQGESGIMMDLYGIGVRKVTLDIEFEGTKVRRTHDLQPPSLAQQIQGRDAAVRTAAIDKLDEMFERGDVADGMGVLQNTRNARYDRKKYLPHVRKSLQSANAKVSALAVKTIAMVGGDASDIPDVLRHLDDKSMHVRSAISSALCALDPAGTHAGVGKAISQLLSDSNNRVRDATLRSLWGRNLPPEVDEKIIELSRGESRGGSGEGDIAVYYALSTRPLIRKSVAERLIEIINTPQVYRSRSVWGISHHQADDTARPIIVNALISLIDTEVVGNVRADAIYGLGYHGGEVALAKLKSIAADPNESAQTRSGALRRLPANMESGAATAASTATAAGKPTELWQQILQPRDPKLREQALEQVKKLLGDESTAKKGLDAVMRSQKAPFVRTPFVELAKTHLDSSRFDVRAQAVAFLGTVGEGGLSIAEVAKFAETPNPLMRRAVIETLLQADPKCEQKETAATIEKLLGDESKDVVVGTLHALWGHPTTKKADESIVELSYHSDFQKDAVYYALTTRPLIRKSVAERLLELAQNSKRHRGRAIWGVTHHAVADDAKELVVKALIEISATTADSYDRTNAIYGLGTIGGDTARNELQRIVSDESESQATRDYVRSLLAGFGATPPDVIE